MIATVTVVSSARFGRAGADVAHVASPVGLGRRSSVGGRISVSATSVLERSARPPVPAADPRRWKALAIIAVAQLMVVLDATIVNIALPQAQQALGISDPNRQWVVTAYTLTFGGLLLLGGRIADYWGRKRTFLLGIIGFALASGLGGLAQDGVTLFAARALQGGFGALLAPASLALLTILFTDAKERAKAFGVYGAIAGGGAAVGLLLGGVLTEYANWRWCLLVNIPIALIAGLFGRRLVGESRAEGNTRYDVPGAALVTVGLAGLVYGFTHAAEKGWGDALTIGFLGGSVALLVAFVVVELRSSHPLLPLRIVLDRTRGGAYIASMLTGAGLIGASLFLSFYFQRILGYRPIEAGLASLPMTVGIFLTFGFATNLLPRVGAKVLMATGSFLAAGGLLLLTRIGLENAFWTTSLPAELVMGAGLGLIFVPLGNVALAGVNPHDAGAAGAMVSATQQVGGSLGVALLTSISVSAATTYATTHAPTATLLNEAAVHSYRVGFAWGAAFLAVAGVAVLALVKGGKGAPADAGTVHAF
jgi:EmrB/QacA subfamily drug resistance transporter